MKPMSPLAVLGRSFDRMFPVSDPPDYEPPVETSIANRAAGLGVTPQELAYELLLEEDGRAMLYIALANYASGTLEPVYDMLIDRNTVLGLGDGGAHYGMISDASYPTYLLSHWTRDRVGRKISLSKAVQALTQETATTVGLEDRGILAPGYKADINLIDYDKLVVRKPRVATDLPAGGRRLLQDADGFVATIVSGVAVMRDGNPTGALPGKLVRGAKAGPS